MGIKNLTKFIKTNYKDCIEELSMDELRNKTLCIDTPCLVYKYKFSSEDWMSQILWFILNLIENNIDAIFVMEGISPIEKKETQEERIVNKNKVIKRSEYLNNLYCLYKSNGLVTEELNIEWKKLSKSDCDFKEEEFEKILEKRKKYTETVTNDDYVKLQNLLNVFNINWVTSINEAETYCCLLNTCKKSDYIYSQDSDILGYAGVNGFINNINFKENKFTFLNKSKLLTRLDLTEDDFIDFCILCGTDYNKTIPKIGIVNAFKIIKKMGSLDNSEYTTASFSYLNIKFIRNKFNLVSEQLNEFIYNWPHFNKKKFYKMQFDYPDFVINEYTTKLLNRIIEEDIFKSVF